MTKKETKMKKNKARIVAGAALAVIVLVAATLLGGGFYMLDYSLAYAKQDRKTTDEQLNRV